MGNSDYYATETALKSKKKLKINFNIVITMCEYIYLLQNYRLQYNEYSGCNCIRSLDCMIMHLLVILYTVLSISHFFFISF